MATTDDDGADSLKRALKLALTKRMYFVLVIKGSEGRLIVSKHPISTGTIVQAKQELPGGQIVKGRCTSGADGLVFETAKMVAPSLAKTIKGVIKRATGLTYNVETRLAPDLDDDREAEDKTDPADARPRRT